MTLRSHAVIAGAGAMIILTLGASVLVWPNDQRARELHEHIIEMRDVGTTSSDITGRLEGMSRELQRLRQQRSEFTRSIPPFADVDTVVAEMIRSLDDQAEVVYGPTIQSGSTGAALPGSGLSEQSLDLRVDMDASLDAIFDLLRSVESMDRLVRVASVRAEADRLGETTDAPLLTTSIGLELVFDPPPAGEGF